MSVPVTFRLYPKPDSDDRKSSLYVRTVVWPTRRAMIDRAKREDWPGARDLWGFCLAYEPKDGEGAAVAEVHLCVPHLTPDVVTHEMLHATFAWARRVRVEWDRVGQVGGESEWFVRDEERICYAHGSLVQQFTARMYGRREAS